MKQISIFFVLLFAFVLTACSEPAANRPAKTAPAPADQKEIFAALVELQDKTPSEEDGGTYKAIADRYGLSEKQVRDISIEGIQEDWPMPQSNIDKESWEYKLATLNAGVPIDASDPTIIEFRQLLDSIGGKTKNTPEQISDMTVKAQEILKNNGIDMTLLKLAHDLDDSMPEGITGANFEEIAAAYLTLKVNQ